ncbi:Peptidoglycan/xylan/chitin deacetylase, PgdA/CDA1 family [Fontibacillus panacisegetis]|uniref:Peptidoglycan/xylan/chitin deacetylase, PgdA/CDA1 family n=1 Tax=Fontibacillus panacisegetis TaxID=670482 RepID=A0A1G7MH12_9BACL|nr:polysaccharide deacetylase family protein [Fontibacillus panacisegetis]SDF60914.1 Peptidoglycan/xylan/chitin deacetylase, PgdA/CDA1 family [Fontibacillus panacisegetis]
MSVYQGKLLELLSVDTKDHQSFLRVQLFSEQEVELLWHIDADTAENLKAVIEPDGVYKYRLSFHSLWDSSKQQHISYLTKTYCDQSDRIYFACSELYVNGLWSIKNDEPISQIQHLTKSSHQQTTASSLETKEVIPKKLKFKVKLTWAVAALTGILFIVLLSSFAPSYIYMSANGKNSKTASVGVSNIGVHLVDNEESSATDSIDPTDLSEPIQYPPASSEPADSNGQAANKSNLDTNTPEIPSEELDKLVSYSIPKGKVALTFDDGPSKYTEEIVDLLKQHEIGGTFFFVGKNVGHYPDSVKYAYNNGYSIGNHSSNHLNLVKQSNDKQEYEILHTNVMLEELIQDKVVLFRPPYGSKNAVTKQILMNNDKKMVLWNIDPEDWRSQNADAIYISIVKSKVNGSIILLHESQATIDALPKIIQYLKDKELQIVNLQ